MRQKNWRLVLAGAFLIVVAVGFFLIMLTMVPRSNDPAAMMQTVGQVSGAATGLAIVLILFGLIGKKA